MEKREIILLVIVGAIILYFPVEFFFFWLPKHKKSMKKFKQDLEESNWRAKNAHKSVGHD